MEVRKRTKGEKLAYIDGFVSGFNRAAEGYHRAAEALENQREIVTALLDWRKEIAEEDERDGGRAE